MFRVPNKYRVREGRMASPDSYGCNGVFLIPYNNEHGALRIIASEGEGWEHVSVSLSDRTPTWQEMAHVKEMFWTDDDCVVQFHPPKSQYVNHHPHCLHLWRPTDHNIPTPPTWMVGPTTST